MKLTEGKNVVQTENDAKNFSQKTWNKLHLQIIFYGREYSPASRKSGARLYYEDAFEDNVVSEGSFSEEKNSNLFCHHHCFCPKSIFSSREQITEDKIFCPYSKISIHEILKLG